MAADANDNAEEEELFPCENFNMVCKGVYRSACPKKRNFPFLKKLRLKSVLTLKLEEYEDQTQRFLNDNGVKLYIFGVAGNKEPFVDIPEETICSALSVIMVLIHCNKGKVGIILGATTGSYCQQHRTGCLVGCLRKIQHWSYTSIFDEYRRFSHPKSRSLDQQFIELFDISKVKVDPRFLPDWPESAFSVDFELLPDDENQTQLADGEG
ncbi:hypothetical protein HK101_005336 [Irineochytrium annulatum]|nr:hypothetical protein HK101_005336 [Irineochytrium annulatum]